MEKNEIIEMVDKFTEEMKDSLLKIDKTQYRDLVEVSKNAEFLDEIELYIKYKISKSSRDWGHNANSKKRTNGDLIIDELKKLTDSDDKKTMSNVSKYFGYLNWKMSYSIFIDKQNKQKNKRW